MLFNLCRDTIEDIPVNLSDHELDYDPADPVDLSDHELHYDPVEPPDELDYDPADPSSDHD